MNYIFGPALNKLKDILIKKNTIQRAVAYLCEKFLGEFTNISPEQLEFDFSWSNQVFSVRDVELKAKPVTEALADVPCEVVEGYLGQVTINIPWKELTSQPVKVHIKDVDITLHPKAPANKAAQLLEAMSASMMHSMDSSMRFAEETVKKDASDKEYSDPSARTQAVEWMAHYLEKVKAMVLMTVENTTIRMEVVDDDKVVGMEIHIDKIEYFDDEVEKAQEARGGEGSFHPLAWFTKNVQVIGITFSLDSEPVPYCPATMHDSTGTSPSELYVSAFEEALEGDAERRHEREKSSRSIPIPIGNIAGRSDIKVKLKAKENVEGPKIDVTTHLGALHAMLSPKQMDCLIKILSLFAAPPESASVSKDPGAFNRRMGPDDYERVGQVLEHELRSGQFEDVTEPLTEDCNYLANGERMFYTLETFPTAGHALSASVSSVDSALSTLPRSGTTEPSQKQIKMSQTSRESTARAASEPTADRSHYQLTVATVSVCLLHEEALDQGGKEWVDKMLELSNTYFHGLRCISTAGQAMSLLQLRDSISNIVPRDHLGLLCKPVTVRVGDRMVRSVQCTSLEVTVHQAELVECLFDSRPHGASFHEEPVRVPQYCEIVTFTNAQMAPPEDTGASMFYSVSGPSPAIFVSTVINSKTGPFGYTFKETKVSVELGGLVMEVDITMQDRLSTVLSTLSTPKPSPASCSQPLLNLDGQYGFDEAMEDVTQSCNAVKFNLSCPHATARIRFPIPDLRPPNNHAPREWWGRNLHKESLLLEIDHLSILKYNGTDQSSSTPSCVEVMCSKLDVYFQEDFNKTPLLFASIMQGPFDVGDNFNRPRIVIKSFPPSGASLFVPQDEFDTDESLGPSDVHDLLFAKPGSTPFSLSREIMHGTEGFEGEDQEGFDSTFERVSPGRKEEMQKFMDVATSNTLLLVDISAPKLLLTLHDKQFLELLYNRLNNDLLLWQPQSPSPPETFASGISLNVQPYINLMGGSMVQSFHEGMFSMQDSDSDDDSPSASHQQNPQNMKVQQPSTLCLNISIGEGKLFANVPLREEDGTIREHCHGQLALLVKEASFFASIGHEGNKDMQYVTFNANRAQLFHAGCVSDSTAPVTMGQLDTLTFEGKHCFEHLTSRIYRSEASVPVEPLSEVGTGEASEDMISVAVQIKIDNWNNNKYFCVAAAVRGGTLRHEAYPNGEGWIPQIMDLLDLKDYPIEGYVMPQVLTDLHLGLEGCAIDYRPKNFELLPLRSLLTVQKFNLTVNLNTLTKYTTLKFLFDEVNLWLSDKEKDEFVLSRDYLRVGHIVLLEVGLRLGQSHEKSSETLLWFGNSKTEFKFCSDSMAALIQLVDHFLHSRDLDTPEPGAEAQVEELQRLSLDERTDAQNRQLQNTIAEALEERSPLGSDGSPVRQQEGGGRPLYFIPGEGGEDPMPLPSLGDLIDESGLTDSSAYYDEEEEEEFTMINEPGMGIAPRNGDPVVTWYADPKALQDINWEFLSKPSSNTSADELRTPPGWPIPQFKCVLREFNLDICFYGGYDFATNRDVKEERLTKKEEHMYPKEKEKDTAKQTQLHSWSGGVSRREDFMVKLTMNKLRMQYEKYNEMEERSRRLVVVVKRVEVEDHLEVSRYNKLLYWPGHDICSEGANMICLKLLWERPDERFNTEECSVRLTLQPIKTHINQNTLMFVQNFLLHLSDDGYIKDEDMEERGASPSPSHTPGRKKSTSSERAPIFRMEGGGQEDRQAGVGDDNLMEFRDVPSASQDSRSRKDRPPRRDVEPEGDPTFFKSFVMTRPATVTIDYTGTGANICGKGVKDLATSALQSVIQLENMLLILRDVELNRGYRGKDKLLEAVLKVWEQDIRSKQLGAVVGGIGPFSIFKTLAQGILDFFTLPIEQYRKDGRLWRGFQKGALSLKTATQSAVLDLLKKLIESLLICSEFCFDFLSSSKNSRRFRALTRGPPKDIREGMSGAIEVVKEGISCTLTDLVKDASQQHEQKGLPGAVGHVIKNLPAVCTLPVNAFSAGVDQCVTGIRYEVRPDLLKEAKEKYKDPH